MSEFCLLSQSHVRFKYLKMHPSVGVRVNENWGLQSSPCNLSKLQSKLLPDRGILKIYCQVVIRRELIMKVHWKWIYCQLNPYPDIRPPFYLTRPPPLPCHWMSHTHSLPSPHCTLTLERIVRFVFLVWYCLVVSLKFELFRRPPKSSSPSYSDLWLRSNHSGLFWVMCASLPALQLWWMDGYSYY